MKTPTTKAQLERLIKQAGSRRQARIKLDMSAPQFYRLIHKLGLKTDERWAKYGKLAKQEKPAEAKS
jgi:hypothetical protein